MVGKLQHMVFGQDFQESAEQTAVRWNDHEMVRQIFIDKVAFNQDLPGDIWDVDAVARRVKK
jgi:hypothetical protein